MRFFIDEAGDFRIPDPGQHRVSLATALAISDLSWPGLSDAYGRFVDRLAPDELADGEPKGTLLTPEHRLQFAELLDRFDGVSVTPVTMDMEHLSELSAEEIAGPLHDRLEDTAEQMIYPRAREEMRLLSRQARNLSLQQILRVFVWARSLFEALHHSMIFLSHGPHAESWNQVRIEIDPVQRRPGSREEQVFSIMLFAWMVAWSIDQPFPLVQGIHTDDHPLVVNYDTPDGIELSRLIRPNLHWPESRNSQGLQMADIAATIVHEAATGLEGNPPAVERFVALMHSSFYGPARGPGLITPLSFDTGRDIEGRYAILSRALQRR